MFWIQNPECRQNFAPEINYYHIIDNYLFFEEFDGSAAYVMNLSNEQIEDFHPKKGK